MLEVKANGHLPLQQPVQTKEIEIILIKWRIQSKLQFSSQIKYSDKKDQAVKHTTIRRAVGISDKKLSNCKFQEIT